MFTIGCMLYSTFAAKYSTHQPVCTLSRLDSEKSSVIAALDTNAYIFESRYLRLFCRNIGHTMHVIFHIWCQAQCTSSGLRYVKSGPRQIQRSCSFVYSGLSIHTDVSPILLHMWLQLEARYTPNLLPNTVHVVPFDACKIGTQPNPAYLQFYVFSIKYSNQRISVSMAHLQTIRCALHLTSDVIYSAHQ